MCLHNTLLPLAWSGNVHCGNRWMVTVETLPADPKTTKSQLRSERLGDERRIKNVCCVLARSMRCWIAFGQEDRWRFNLFSGLGLEADLVMIGVAFCILDVSHSISMFDVCVLGWMFGILVVWLFTVPTNILRVVNWVNQSHPTRDQLAVSAYSQIMDHQVSCCKN